MVSAERTPDGADDKAVTKLECQQLPSSNGSEKNLQEPDTGIHISLLDKDGSISSITPRALLSPHTVSPALPTAQEGKTPVVRDKGFDDGYHWRKYGQKLVKGNEFVRSYYKCTHPSCLVKKQLERSHSGHLADIVYFGEHVHPKPVNNVPMAVGFVLSVEERSEGHSPIATKDKTAKAGKETSQVESTNNSQVSTVTTLSNNAKHVLAESKKLRDHIDIDDDQRSKRQKKNSHNPDLASAEKLTGESRFVVQTMSEVNIVNDGYRWRKYGQKMVKGNPNPRSYYRCSTPGCPAKKHVERASHDQKLIISSYEGQHDHDIPPSRSVAHNEIDTALEAESGAKCGRSEVHDDSTPKSEPVPVNNVLISKGSGKAVHSSPDTEDKSEQQKGKPSAAEEKANTGVVTLVITSSVSNGRPSEKQNAHTNSEPEDKVGAHGVENNHHIPKSEPVNS